MSSLLTLEHLQTRPTRLEEPVKLFLQQTNCFLTLWVLLVRIPTGIWKQKMPEEIIKIKKRGWTKGKKRPQFSDEHKNKLKESLTGLRRSKETRLKISLSKKGDRHPNWKGGIWNTKEYNKNYRKLHPRTNFEHTPYRRYKKDKCEFCGFIPVQLCQLDVDHIDGNHKNNLVENLQTLCANCHRLKSFLKGEFPFKKGISK